MTTVCSGQRGCCAPAARFLSHPAAVEAWTLGLYTVSMQPPYRIEQAFLHLAFSVKLFEHFRRGRVSKDAFDCAIDIPTPQGSFHLPAGLFHTNNDLVLAAENTYSAAVGVCAIAMETALVAAAIPNTATDMSAK